MGFLTWAQVATMIQSGRTLGIGYARSDLERHSDSDDFQDFFDLVKQLRDVAEGNELARNYDADDVATELAEYGTALLAVRTGCAGGPGGGWQGASKLLRTLAGASDEDTMRRIIDEIASIARSTDDSERADMARELVNYGRSIL